jgi:hypothetical protein
LVVAVALLAFSLVVALNLVATVRLMRSEVYSAKQKAVQVVLIWFIPLVGAMVVLGVLNPPREPQRNRPSDMSAVRDDLWIASQSDGTSSHDSGASGHGDS